jgi:predicted nucleic acid-binding protein
MGVIVLPPSGPAYADASAVIYAIERIEPYYSAGLPLWDALDAGTQQVVTSELTVLEVLVKPLRDGDLALADLYRQVLLATTNLFCRPISLAVLERAALIRAQQRLRAPDAIHAAEALESGCSIFVTNDPDFSRVPGLSVAVLGDIAAN